MVRRLLFCDADFCISIGRIYYRQSLGCVHKRRDRSCSLPFLFFSLFSPPIGFAIPRSFAWNTLPLSRANICRYTLKRSEKRRRDTLAKFGISTNLSSTNIHLLVCRERPCTPRSYSPANPLRVLSAILTTSSHRIFASFDIERFPVTLYRSPCQTTFHRRGELILVKLILCMKAEYVKYV